MEGLAPASQQSVLRFCWDETHLQLVRAALSDSDVVGRGAAQCDAADSVAGGDQLRVRCNGVSDHHLPQPHHLIVIFFSHLHCDSEELSLSLCGRS